MLGNWIRKSALGAVLRLLPAAFLASLSDAAMLLGIRSFVEILSGRARIGVFEWALLMILLSAFRFFCLKRRLFLSEKIFLRADALLKARFLRVLQRLHPKFYHSERADSKWRAAFEATTVLSESGESLLQTIQAAVQLVIFLPVLLYLSWELSAVLFLVVLPFVSLAQKKLRNMGGEERKLLFFAGSLRSSFENARDFFRLWSHKFERRFVIHSVFSFVEDIFSSSLSLAKRKISLALAIETISVVAMIFVFSACALMIEKGILNAEEMILYSSAAFLCYRPVKDFARALPKLRAAFSACHELEAFENFERFFPEKKWRKRLEIQNGFFSYENTAVFKNFSLTIDFYSHDFFYFVGKNGAGKTTLLRLISGLESFDSGNLTLPECARGGVFFLSQSAFLPPREILRAQLNSLDEEKRRALSDFEESLGARSLLEKNAYSSGERARIGLWWALASGASLLLLDEPFASVSLSERENLMLLFLDAAKKLNKKMILSGHEALSQAARKQFEFIEIEKS